MKNKIVPYIAIMPLTIIFLYSFISVTLEYPKLLYFYAFLFGAVLPAYWGLEKLSNKEK